MFSKYAWFVPVKDENRTTITNAFQKVLDESKHKPNKILIDKDGEFYSRSMKSWLDKNDIEMYSTHNEGESIVAERFIRTLKTKIYKHMTSVSKNVYIVKFNDIVSNMTPVGIKDKKSKKK